MVEDSMKKVLAIMAMVLMFAGTSFAGTLQWDHSGADGFIFYYTDGTNNYNYNLVGDVRTCDTGLLNLAPGVEYTIYVTSYNETAESGPSNSVVYTRDIFIPPEDVLPIYTPAPGSPVLQIL